jgi:hypothetical protein
MVMTYTSLVAPKGTTGSIANWVNYTKLDLPAVLDEAQSLIYQVLRVREMKKEWVFGVIAGQSAVSLPTRFLDPIGEMFDLVNQTKYDHLIEGQTNERRTYEEATGSYGTDPFTTTLDSSLVSVEDTAHDLTQDSAITIAAASAVGGLTLNGTFPIVSVTDADNYVIDTGDTLATSSATGGGSSATFTAQRLIDGSPTCWSVWNEQVKFDVAFDAPATMKQMYFRQPELLSATNLSNFLTVRYPKLVRVATCAAAADFMKDDTEYNKHSTALINLIQTTAASDDMIYRGASFGTETPYAR